MSNFRDACTAVLNGGMIQADLPAIYVAPSRLGGNTLEVCEHSPFFFSPAPEGAFGLAGDFQSARFALGPEGQMYASDLRFVSTDYSAMDGKVPKDMLRIGDGTKRVIIAGDIYTAAAINYFVGDSAVAPVRSHDYGAVAKYFCDQGVDSVVLYPNNTDVSRLFARAASVQTGAEMAAISADYFPGHMGLLDTLRTANFGYSSERPEKADLYLNADIERLIINPIKNSRPIPRSQNKAMTLDNDIQR